MASIPQEEILYRDFVKKISSTDKMDSLYKVLDKWLKDSDWNTKIDQYLESCMSSAEKKSIGELFEELAHILEMDVKVNEKDIEETARELVKSEQLQISDKEKMELFKKWLSVLRNNDKRDT